VPSVGANFEFTNISQGSVTTFLRSDQNVSPVSFELVTDGIYKSVTEWFDAVS